MSCHRRTMNSKERVKKREKNPLSKGILHIQMSWAGTLYVTVTILPGIFRIGSNIDYLFLQQYDVAVVSANYVRLT